MDRRIALLSATAALGTLIVLVAGELWIHWYASTHETALAHRIRGVCLYRDADNGKAYGAGFIELIIPGVAFGLTAGIAARHWPAWALICCDLVGALVFLLAALAYRKVAPSLFPPGASGHPEAMVIYYLKMLSLCGFFSLLGRGTRTQSNTIG